MVRWAVVVFTLIVVSSVRGDGAFCFDAAADRFLLSATLLQAVAVQESGLKPTAVHRNADGTVDVGLMQVNSRWFATLERYGINEQGLFDPCTNVYVGAWILAQNADRYGYTWEAVGSYNVGTAKTPLATRRRMEYAQHIARRVRDLTFDGRLHPEQRSQ